MQHDNDTLFSDKADVYRRARPDYPDALITYLSGLCQHHDLAWDCACGSGQATEKLARHFQKIEATDVSPEQLSHTPLIDNVNFFACRAEATPFNDQCFDLINVAQALHWFATADFWAEVKRVIKPGGVFAAFGYNWPVWGDDLAPIIEREVLHRITPYFASNNQLLWNRYRDIEFPFTPISTPDFSTQLHWSLDELFEFLHSASATRRYMQVHGEQFFQHAYNQVAEVWGNVSQRRTFEMELVLIAGRP